MATATYDTIKFIHAILGLGPPPPEEELGDLDVYAESLLAGVDVTLVYMRAMREMYAQPTTFLKDFETK